MAPAGIEPATELSRSVKEHHLLAKTKAEKKKIREPIVKPQRSVELDDQGSAPASEPSRRASGSRSASAKWQRLMEVARQLLPPHQAVDADGQSGHREDDPRWQKLSAGDGQRQGPSEVRDEMVDGSAARRRSLPSPRRGPQPRENQMPEAGWKDDRGVCGKKATRADGRLRSRSELAGCGREAGPGRGQAGRDPPTWTRRLDGRGEGAKSGPERTWQDRRQHRPANEQKIRILSSPGAQCRNAGCSRAAARRVGEFEHPDEGFSRTSQSRKLGAGLKDERDNKREKVIKRG